MKTHANGLHYVLNVYRCLGHEFVTVDCVFNREMKHAAMEATAPSAQTKSNIAIISEICDLLRHKLA